MRHGYRVDAEYFYPASTIKLCTAVAALAELPRLRAATGLPLTACSPLRFHPLPDRLLPSAAAEGEQVCEDSDPSNLQGGAVTLAHEARAHLLRAGELPIAQAWPSTCFLFRCKLLCWVLSPLFSDSS